MRTYYRGPGEEKILLSLIEAAGRNTLLVEQMARSMEQSWGELTPEKLLSKMNVRPSEEGGVLEQIRLLYDLSVLSPRSREIMAHAALIPAGGVQGATFLKCHDEIQQDKIRLLELGG